MVKTRVDRNPIELSDVLNSGSDIVIKQLSDAGVKNVSKFQAKSILAQPIREFIIHSSFCVLQKPRTRRKKIVVVVKTK